VKVAYADKDRTNDDEPVWAAFVDYYGRGVIQKKPSTDAESTPPPPPPPSPPPPRGVIENELSLDRR